MKRRIRPGNIPQSIKSIRTVADLLTGDDILECLEDLQANKTDLKQLLVIGRNKNEQILIINSNLEAGDCIYLCEAAKYAILNDSGDEGQQ